MNRHESLWNRVEAEAVKIAGVNAFPSQFNPVPALWFEGREFASFHDGEISLGLPARSIRELKDKGDLIGERSSGSRDWIWLRLRTKVELPRVIKLIRIAVEEQRKKGAAPRPMPDDKALARRRRLHRQPTHDLDF